MAQVDPGPLELSRALQFAAAFRGGSAKLVRRLVGLRLAIAREKMGPNWLYWNLLLGCVEKSSGECKGSGTESYLWGEADTCVLVYCGRGGMDEHDDNFKLRATK